jgi:hypothetical protein
MSKWLIASLLVLPLVAVVPAHAFGGCPGGHKFSFSFCVDVGKTCQAGPWYLYWPYEAHFTTPPPVGGCYPYWPAGGGYAEYGAPLGAQTLTPPTGGGIPHQPASVIPTGAFMQAPNYWYGR